MSNFYSAKMPCKLYISRHWRAGENTTASTKKLTMWFGRLLHHMINSRQLREYLIIRETWKMGSDLEEIRRG